MPRGDWRILAALVGLIAALAAAAVLAVSLYPEQPQLSGDSSKQEQSASYRPGGADCQPSEIEGLGGRERARRAVACQEAEEEHRLKANDLIHQRRSADAADAVALLTYEQTRIAAWGIALGFITMAAAIAAAFYARSAAVHSAKSHKAFVSAERAILRVVSAREGMLTGGRQEQDVIGVTFKNIGSTSARVTAFGSVTHNSAPRWSDVPADREAVVPGPAVPDDYNTILDGWFWIEYSIIGGGAGTTNFRLSGSWHRPDGPFAGGWFFEVANTNGHPHDT